MVDARGKSMPKYNSMVQEYREFDGKDTVLIYSRTYKLSFVCDFDHHYYPFDTQKCPIQVPIALLISLKPGTIIAV